MVVASGQLEGRGQLPLAFGKAVGRPIIPRATLAVLWIALNTVLVINFVSLGRYPSPPLTLAIAAAVIPGRVLGELLHRRLDARTLERAVWLVLLVAGAELALRSL